MLRKNIAILSLLSLTLVAVSAFAMEKSVEGPAKKSKFTDEKKEFLQIKRIISEYITINRAIIENKRDLLPDNTRVEVMITVSPELYRFLIIYFYDPISNRIKCSYNVSPGKAEVKITVSPRLRQLLMIYFHDPIITRIIGPSRENNK